MRLPALYAIANIDALSEPLDYIRVLIRSGVSLLQLRAKDVDLRTLRELAKSSLEEISNQESKSKLIINDHIALCKEVGAHGVHLGQEDQAPEVARQLLGPDALIGLSSHTIEQVSSAPFSLLDYLAFGPVFSSTTKVGHAEICGSEKLSEVAKLCPLPLVAIGGITRENVGEIFSAGAESAAVIADLAASEDKAEYVRLFERERSLQQAQTEAQ